MSTENKFSLIYRDENDHSTVVSFGNHFTLKVSKLLQVANQMLKEKTLNELEEKLKQLGAGSLASLNKIEWNSQGIKAEILEPNFNNWKKGKIRIRVVLEFCPDEPEEKVVTTSSNSPLDDFR
jgi:hypothetical protein